RSEDKLFQALISSIEISNWLAIANKVSPASIVYVVASLSASVSSAGAALGASASTLRTSPGKIRSEDKLFNDLISLMDCDAPAEMLQSVSPDSTVTSDADILAAATADNRSEEHTSELQSRFDLVCRILLEKK